MVYFHVSRKTIFFKVQGWLQTFMGGGVQFFSGGGGGGGGVQMLI